MTAEEAEVSGQEIMKQLVERRAAQKKDLNRNVFGVRTNDDLAALLREHCKSNNVSTNQFLNNLLKQFFNYGL
jgi:predicted HicB family RNase H-like nuclease